MLEKKEEVEQERKRDRIQQRPEKTPLADNLKKLLLRPILNTFHQKHKLHRTGETKTKQKHNTKQNINHKVGNNLAHTHTGANQQSGWSG